MWEQLTEFVSWHTDNENVYPALGEDFPNLNKQQRRSVFCLEYLFNIPCSFQWTESSFVLKSFNVYTCYDILAGREPCRQGREATCSKLFRILVWQKSIQLEVLTNRRRLDSVITIRPIPSAWQVFTTTKQKWILYTIQ